MRFKSFSLGEHPSSQDSRSVEFLHTNADLRALGIHASQTCESRYLTTVRLGGWISENYVFKSFPIDLTLKSSRVTENGKMSHSASNDLLILRSDHQNVSER